MDQTEIKVRWPPGTGEMALRAREHDWAATSLGSPEGWPRSLRAIVEMLLDHPFPMAVLWGPENIKIYNDSYHQILGVNQLATLGQPFNEIWPEVRDTNEPLVGRTLAGETVTLKDVDFSNAHPGALANTWYDLTLSPLRDDAGLISGALVTVLETTARVLAEQARERIALELREVQEAHHALLQSIGDGFCIVEVLFDDEGQPCDYLFLNVNPAFESQTGLVGAAGRTARDLVADHPQHWFSTFGRIVRGGRAERFEAPQEALGRLYDVYAVPVGAPGQDRLAVLFKDILPKVQAEAALRASEERFRAFVTASSDAVYRMNPDWSEMRMLEGRGFLSDTAGPIASWMDHYIDPEDHSSVQTAIASAIASKSLFELEHRVRRADGTSAWTMSRAVPILDEQGGIVEWLGTARDVTGRREAEEALSASQGRQAFLLRLSDALRAEPSAEGVMEQALRMLSEQLRLDRCYVGVYRLAEDTGEFPHQVHKDHLPPLPAQVRLSDFPAALQVAFDRTLVIDDVVEMKGLSDGDRASFSGLGLRALIAATLRKGENSPLWAICAVSIGPRVWTPSEVALVEEVAERTWTAVERVRTEIHLREREERLRAIFETAQDYAILTTDPQGRVETWSTGAEKVLGWSADEIVGEVIDVIFTPEDRAAGVPEQERHTAREQGLAPDVRWHLCKNGGLVFIEGATRPLTSQDGSLEGFVKIAQDVTERRVIEERLRASEALFRQFGEASSGVLWIRDAPRLRFDYVSPAFEEVYGETFERLFAGNDLRTWAKLILPEDRSSALAAFRRVRQGERVTHEFRIRRPSDGALRWVRDTDFPIWDADGGVARVAGIGYDVTELKRAEAAVTESGLRFRSLAEGIPQLVWRVADHGEWTWASPQWMAFTGQTETASYGSGWLDAVHPDDRQGARDAWERSRTTGTFEVELRLREGATDKYCWFQNRAAQVRDEAGKLVEWLGTSTDVQVLKELQERQAVLVAELQHRTRNLMGVVRATMDATLRGHPTVEQFVPAFRGRLGALARVNGLLSRLNEGDRITFDELIQAELSALGAVDADGRSERVTLDGPKGVRLQSSTVQTFALALHELATNAAKYGALKQPAGHLAVRWRRMQGADGRADGPRLRVEWTETGVVMPEPGAAPQGGGYGRTLIERALPYQLGAETHYEMGPDGVRCTVTLPLSSTEERTHA